MRGQLKVRDWTKGREERSEWLPRVTGVHKEGVVCARAMPSIFPMSLQALWEGLGWGR